MAKTLFELLESLPDDDVLAVSGGDAMLQNPVVESTEDLKPGGVFVARPLGEQGTARAISSRPRSCSSMVVSGWPNTESGCA